MSKVRGIGIIAEDMTDYNAAKVLISRISQRENLSFKPKVGNGSGKIKNKCVAWSRELSQKGCNLLILIHDLDSNNIHQLRQDLSTRLKDSCIENQFICIPIEELEAWFLSDAKNIMATFKLSREPKIKGLPETIPSPKEHLGKLINNCSNNEIIYLTAHNQILAKNMSLDVAQNRSPSFKEFYNFIAAQQF